ncbi:MAG: hypothetical protein EA379_00385 [Phycisphaerales bacterium]|nr:MAG: hypothetical protein EA379_00385 [Phycisphaerales bacterium]
MARSRKGPALFELVSDRTPRQQVRPQTDAGAAAPARPTPRPTPVVADAADGAWWRGGGRSLRIPVGYVFVAGAIVFALCIGFFVLGAHQGGRAERERYARDASAAWLGPDSDPLNDAAPGSGAGPVQQATRPTQAVPDPAQSAPTRATNRSQQTAPAPATGGARLGEGLNHFIIARLGPDEAHRAAAFLRSHGLDVGVFAADNPRFREVIALRGFGAGSGPDGVGGSEANALRSDIRRVGRLYKAQASGPTDFADVYAFRIDARRARMTAEPPR